MRGDLASPHCTSTCRIVSSLMTMRSGTSRNTMRIVTSHGMPVRWSTTHYRFSRAPCTAAQYGRPSLACTFTSFYLSSSQLASLALAPEFPSLFLQPSSLLAWESSLSVPVPVVISLSRILFLRALRPDRDHNMYLSSFPVYHPPPDTITEFSHSLQCRCSPPLPPPSFLPAIALSPSASISLLLSTIGILSLPLDLLSLFLCFSFVLSLFLSIRLLRAPYRAFQ